MNIKKNYNNIKKNSDIPKTTASIKSPLPNFNIQIPHWIGLSVLFLLMLVLRWRMLDLPLERDESAYAYIGQRLLEGGRPYLDYYEMKPPFLFISYALINTIFGYSEGGLRWAALFFTFVNAGLVFAIAKRFYPSNFAFLACFCYLLLTSSPYSAAVFMSSELVVMAFVLGALYLSILWHQSTQKKSWLLIGSGFLLALSTLTKQTGLLFGVIPAFLLFHDFWTKTPRQYRNLLQNMAYFALGLVIPIAICAIWLIKIGSWEAFIYWNHTYLSKYSNTVEWNEANHILESSFKMLTKHVSLLWCLGLGGLLALLMRNLPIYQRITIILLLLCGGISVFLGKRFYLHYWLHILPVLAILICHLCYTVFTFLENKKISWLALPIIGLLFLLSIMDLKTIWTSSNLNGCMYEMFMGNAFVESKVLADFLEKRLKPEDMVVALGSEPQFYVYLHKKAPSRHFYSAFLNRQTEYSLDWQKEALQDLTQSKPKYLIFPLIKHSWMLKENTKTDYYYGAWKMMREQYKVIATVELSPNGKPIYFYDASAEAHKPSTTEYILITERK
jgi:hypothetical protein